MATKDEALSHDNGSSSFERGSNLCRPVRYCCLELAALPLHAAVNDVLSVVVLLWHGADRLIGCLPL